MRLIWLRTHYRGKRNESAFVRLVAETAAEIIGKSVEEIAKITTENAMKCFGIDENGYESQAFRDIQVKKLIFNPKIADFSRDFP